MSSRESTMTHGKPPATGGGCKTLGRSVALLGTYPCPACVQLPRPGELDYAITDEWCHVWTSCLRHTQQERVRVRWASQRLPHGHMSFRSGLRRAPMTSRPSIFDARSPPPWLRQVEPMFRTMFDKCSGPWSVVRGPWMRMRMRSGDRIGRVYPANDQTWRLPCT